MPEHRLNFITTKSLFAKHILLISSPKYLNKMLTNGFSFDNEDALSEITQLVI